MQLVLSDQCTEPVLCLSQPLSDVQELVCENCSILEPALLAKLREKAISAGEMEPGKGALNSHVLSREQTAFPVNCKPFA